VGGSKTVGRFRARFACLAVVGVLLVLPGPISAQSLTAGSLQGTVRTADGEVLSGAAVTVEDQGGGTVRELTTRRDGTFALQMMLPGTYNVLVEVAGFRPVRLRGVLVASGRTTTVSAELVEQPPPISSVNEILQSGTSAGPVGRLVLERELRTLEFRRDATDIARGMSEVAAPLDGREGFAIAAGGFPNRMSKAYVDGVPEVLLRHPGYPGEPATLPGFQREAFSQGQVSSGALDAEWRGNPGTDLSFLTRSGSNRLEFAPYLAGSSAKLGGNRPLNPADSSGTSLWAGATLGGPIKRDTANFFLQGGYQSVELPSAFPWVDPAGSLRDAVLQTALSEHGTDLSSSVQPAVRTWKGGSALGRMDWRVGGNSRVMLRAGGSSFKEANPELGFDVGNHAGASLSGRDVSAAGALTTISKFANELRLGLAVSRRDWKSSALPETRLVAEGIRVGGDAGLPGRFETQVLSLADAIQYGSGAHAIKAGVSIEVTSYKQQFDYGSAGRFLFGDLDHFGSATGAFFRAAATVSEARITASQVGAFVQDVWRVSPGFDLLLGLRYETQVLPTNKIVANQEWLTLAGVPNNQAPRDRRGIQPRLGFVLNPGTAGNWSIEGGFGLYATGIDPSQFAEAVHYSGSNVRIARTLGNLSWPSGSGTPGPIRLSLFGGTDQFRAPRTLKADLVFSRSFAGGVLARLSGNYHHSDYLQRRADLNLAPFPFGQTQEGRPVWGALAQQGGLVTVVPSSSRRFTQFDLATVFNPTGFSDHYEATVSLSRSLGRTIFFAAEYTFSRTRDNLVGLLQPDPADQLSPFPGGINGEDWDTGRSDLDIPHRLAGSLEFRTGGGNPISVMLRGRYRSGLPFTPGFPNGVDLNGDLGGNNDPAPASGVVTPTGPDVRASCDGTTTAGFAARNSCRQNGVGSLDVRLGIQLPMSRGPGRLVLTLEAFNVVATTTGVIDRAALLIDRAGTLSPNPTTGAVQIPYVSNPQFGTLLRRGGEPRVVRLGARVEY
jgi:hypothetical protein